MTPSRSDLANAIRALSMDAVQKANSGHPGMPMGMADIATSLWNKYLSHNPTNPSWFNRDRVVLSNGHGSMLLYSVLHLTGYDVSIDDIKNFRQFESNTPGHPEYGMTPGVETTTGPLGQGVANAVGMALSEKILADSFNKPELDIVDHFTYVLLGDGCLMEGISHEACSLAGVYGLGKLIAVYDDNGISIDGDVAGWFQDDTPKRFESYGWQVISDVDGHDPAGLDAAIEAAQQETNKPTLICAKTVIGYGSPNKAGTAGSHGAALGEDEITLTREKLGWQEAPFTLPEAVKAAWDGKEKGQAAESAWNELFATYKSKFPAEAAEFERRIAGELPDCWSETISQYIENVTAPEKAIASRKASGNVLNALGPVMPELIGGSADLSGSNLTNWKGCKTLKPGEFDLANYINYGVREFAMSAMMNGMALHDGFIPYGGTFLVFSDYARNAVRLSALMKIRTIYVYTHDSIGLGEDGPTHQPVEHMSSLRIMPNLHSWRPCDEFETAVSWKAAIERQDGPTCLVLSRQNLAPQKRDQNHIELVAKGGYVLVEPETTPKAIIIATGSEVELAVEAAAELTSSGMPTRVVSMPCAEVFATQSIEYQASVLPPEITNRVAVEAGQPDFWYKYVGLNGRVIGMTTFGESAPADELFKHFGFTVENIINQVKEIG